MVQRWPKRLEMLDVRQPASVTPGMLLRHASALAPVLLVMVSCAGAESTAPDGNASGAAGAAAGGAPAPGGEDPSGNSGGASQMDPGAAGGAGTVPPGGNPGQAGGSQNQGGNPSAEGGSAGGPAGGQSSGGTGGAPAGGDGNTPEPPADPTTITYQHDPLWPKALPNNWNLGWVTGIEADAQDHIWLLHRPSDVQNAAPPVLEFDQAGNLLRQWGGPGGGFEWPMQEHGLHIDHTGAFWLGGNNAADTQVLKFSKDGTFLLQIGKANTAGNNESKDLLSKPADIVVDAEANEVFIADGYGSQRVVVFDADSGAYKRHWTQAGGQQFKSPVHCIEQSPDKLIYVCERGGNRLPVFKPDGTFVREIFADGGQNGVTEVHDLAFSADGQVLHIADGGSDKAFRFLLKEGSQIDQLGNSDQYTTIHGIASDALGNVYVAEIMGRNTVQRYVKQ